MFSIEEIKELISALDNSSVCELEITAKDNSFKIKKGDSGSAAPVQTVVSNTSVAAAPVLEIKAKAQSESAPTAPQNELDFISAPMVGVFYEAPSPDSKPFVAVGQTVSKGDTVCIIEAMKLMNEITAEKSGTIAEVCVKNGDIVEFGQPLFKIK